MTTPDTRTASEDSPGRGSDAGRSTIARTLAGAAIAAVLLLGVGWLSRAPYTQPGAETGVLRLSWRWRTEREETCRQRTPAELDALPVHMRTPELCEGRLVAYRLVVAVGDAAPDTMLVVPGGARADRPLFVFRETPLAPGPQRVRVQFERDDASATTAPPITFNETLHAEAGAIELITLDPATRSFVHVRPGSR